MMTGKADIPFMWQGGGLELFAETSGLFATERGDIRPRQDSCRGALALSTLADPGPV